MTTAPAYRPRDPRLDFFRGLGMFIILIAHIHWNSWVNWIPARFGFSDAADLFVFCSGMASALAFARIFEARGWLLGTARILHRMWQVYWAQIGCFLIGFSILATADLWLGRATYIPLVGLEAFVDNPMLYVPSLMTLTFLPPYFDILPMYLVILAMIPLVMALARLSPNLALATIVIIWFLGNRGILHLTADLQTGRMWYFNPFAWQLVFFTGFAFIKGWLPAPPRSAWLAALAMALILFAAPVSCNAGYQCYAGFGHVPLFGEIREWLEPVTDKTGMGPLRYAHFLATAYIAFLLVGERGERLRGRLVEITIKVGQQTLAVFLTGLVAAQLLSILVNEAGRGWLVVLVANLLGFATLIATAFVAAWFKASPWKEKGARAPSPE